MKTSSKIEPEVEVGDDLKVLPSILRILGDRTFIRRAPMTANPFVLNKDS